MQLKNFNIDIIVGDVCTGYGGHIIIKTFFT